MLHHIISITKGEVKRLRVRLHPSKHMHYVDLDGVRISTFFSSQKQGQAEIQKIKASFSNFDTWEVIYYENVMNNLGGQHNGN